ncbi:hypothetical protein EVAR_24250_1 [Eumeta japonica]|uniref:Uncharacterized protein n=1 Tax=Eumeta variegata TaxID=151549 RepID=A0A4C1VET2_EUMVA|nr:hypothetical protein EVAR_24250_1 [Eumeta japonica]
MEEKLGLRKGEGLMKERCEMTEGQWATVTLIHWTKANIRNCYFTPVFLTVPTRGVDFKPITPRACWWSPATVVTDTATDTYGKILSRESGTSVIGI